MFKVSLLKADSSIDICALGLMSRPIQSLAVCRDDFVGIEAQRVAALEATRFTSLAKWTFGSHIYVEP